MTENNPKTIDSSLSNRKLIQGDVFLLTSASPNHNGIGTIFIRDILSHIKNINTVWYVENPFLLKVQKFGLGILGRALNSILVRLKPWQDLRFYLFLRFKLKKRVNIIDEAYRESGAKLIWATTSTPELICIASNLAQRNHDVRVTVWDAPEYLLKNLGFSKQNCAIVNKHFDDLMSKAGAASVISNNMQQTYSKRFPRLPLNIMRHGIGQIKRPMKQDTKSPIRFVFAGSLYSKQEWNAFVAALEHANWCIGGRDVSLAFIGKFPLKGASYPPRLEHYDFMSQDKAMELMTHMDIGYLPYWLNPEHELVARTSFPGKMTAYSAAGLSVFHHGPRTSSVTEFLLKYPYGLACDSLEPTIVLQHLERLIMHMNSSEHIEAREKAMSDALSDITMIASFKQLIAAK